MQSILPRYDGKQDLQPVTLRPDLNFILNALNLHAPNNGKLRKMKGSSIKKDLTPMAGKTLASSKLLERIELLERKG